MLLKQIFLRGAVDNQVCLGKGGYKNYLTHFGIKPSLNKVAKSLI